MCLCEKIDITTFVMSIIYGLFRIIDSQHFRIIPFLIQGWCPEKDIRGDPFGQQHQNICGLAARSWTTWKVGEYMDVSKNRGKTPQNGWFIINGKPY